MRPIFTDPPFEMVAPILLLLLAAPHACSAIQEDADRLACFDRAFPAPVPKAAGWKLGIQTSSMDDSQLFTVHRSADKAIATPRGRTLPVLEVSCYKGSLDFAVMVGTYVAGDYAAVRIRLDKDPAEELRMMVSGNSGVATVDDANAPIAAILYRFTKHRTLLVEIPTDDSNAVVVAFTLQGLEAKLPKLKKACGATMGLWPEGTLDAQTWWSSIPVAE